MAYNLNMFMASMLHLGFALVALALVVAALVLAFEIWMFVDVIKSRGLSHEERAIWIIGMLLLHPFVAIVYYFMRRSDTIK